MLRIPTLTLLFFVLSNFSKPYPLPLSVLPSKLSPSHSVSISLGSPPIDVALIVDSGSHHLALLCSHDLKKGKGKGGDYEVGKSISAAYHDCESCPHETQCDGGFCVHTQGYSEGSKWTSKTVTDKVSNLGVESKSLTESTIYCITEQTGMFEDQPEDGLLGLARGADLLQSFGSSESSSPPSYRLCMTPVGGYIDFEPSDSDSGSDSDKLDAPHSQLIKNTNDYYSVKIDHIALGGVLLQCNKVYYNRGKGTILDTGTTDIYLPRDCRASFEKIWRDLTERAFHNDEAYYDYAEFEMLPSLVFYVAGGTEFTVHPSSYMEGTDTLGHFTCRIYLDEQYGIIVGAFGLQYHAIDFEGGGVRIKESECW
ncbi:hypothetical protein TrST_g1507 [Triparma strigata]|uniref:Peptidase A1 domain-containing protein n=1 Tax=Triparma strigata TaxID=1606541 RepID=A0A9W7BHK8_9STRA|nr:hypothetical protein TrST_g1507 [Triparma strigata]